MKATYDPEVDAISLRLSRAKIVESKMIQPGVILDYDSKDRVVGIEILSFSKRFGEIVELGLGKRGNRGRTKTKSSLRTQA